VARRVRQRLGMRSVRVLRMGLPEIASRSRQELRKRFDRLAVADRPRAVSTVFDRLARTAELDAIREDAWSDADAASRQLLERFRALGPARFFEGAVGDEVGRRVAARVPGAADEALAAAESILAGRFDLLGYRGLSFGDPVDWHLDPVSGRRAPRVHWSHIATLDAPRIGDSKVIWELNRHQWLVRLGQAYRLSRDERYADAFAASVRAWMRDNPPEIGINWASSLEVALRLVAWTWALYLFRDSAALSPGLFVEMLDSVAAHARHVERYLSY